MSREKINFDKNWLFHKGDIEIEFGEDKDIAYYSAKTQRKQMGPASPDYERKWTLDESWQEVDLPHDYVIEEVPDKRFNEGFSFLKHHNSWYIKKFNLDKNDQSCRISLYFEGVATHATIYVNGCLMKHSFCGYTSFEVDITDVVHEGENKVAVYVNTQNHEGWWYEGGGIYRHVWLVKTDLVSVDLWGVYACPQKMSDTEWMVKTETTIRNDSVLNKRVKICGEIINSDNAVVSTSEISGSVRNKEKRVFNYSFNVKTPDLWSPESPKQYIMRTRVFVGQNEVDVYDVKFGFRTLRLEAETGLYINDKRYKIKGVCGHADFGLTGKAVPDNIHRYKVKLIKEMGANGFRCVHYPHAEALMDALDENGFIVMNETRWFESTEEGKAQLEMLVKRDRNRPGVIFWSTGNEEPTHMTPVGKKIMQSLAALIKKLDDSRFITTAVSFTPENATVYDDVDCIAINYNWKSYPIVHEKFRHLPVLSSENCATGTTRGWYFDEDDNRKFLPAYDRNTNAEYMARENTWKFIDKNDWIIGGYQWIAFEHRGEAKWPRLCSQSGAIDLFMQKKDAFYQNKSHWTTEPMVHLLPHWNFRGLEGEPIRVLAYTNTKRVELFLNKKSLGSAEVSKHGHAEWTVPYEKGEIEVVAYEGNEIVATDKRVTSGAPKKLILKLENEDIKANGEDIAVISCYFVDEDGNEVYDACNVVNFSTNSLGRVYSTGSDITDHTSLFLPTRKMRAGRIGVAVKVGEIPGELKVFAQSENVESAVLKIDLSEK